jgi:hypothetical protein
MKNRNPFFLAIAPWSLLFLSSCHSAPSRDIFGSYFPSWMLCSVVGITLAVIVRLIMIRIRVDEFIPRKVLVYVSFGVSLTFLTWLIWFGN